MKKPLVSVIIPTYQTKDFVGEAIDSVLAQTYPNIEILVVDDGSVDGTEEFCKAKYGSRITYIYQENRGLAGSRNTGMRNAHGEFFALLDADDMFLPNKVERQVDYLLTHPECDVSYCGLYHFYDGAPERLFTLNLTYYSGADIFPNLLKRNFINPLTVVMRRRVMEKIGFFDEFYRHGEDWDYWLRSSYQGARFCYLPEQLGKYRMWRGGHPYSWKMEKRIKTYRVQMFVHLQESMTPVDQKRYHMGWAVLTHRASSGWFI